MPGDILQAFCPPSKLWLPLLGREGNPTVPYASSGASHCDFLGVPKFKSDLDIEDM